MLSVEQSVDKIPEFVGGLVDRDRMDVCAGPNS